MTDRASLPDFELPATGNQRFQLSAFKGHPVVLYFYPRDDTPCALVRAALGRRGARVRHLRRDEDEEHVWPAVRGIERSTA